MTPAQMTVYTFEALEAWSREQGMERSSDQTPLEFAEAFARQKPTAAKEVSQTASLYAGVAYARRAPGRDSLDVLERLWRRMQSE